MYCFITTIKDGGNTPILLQTTIWNKQFLRKKLFKIILRKSFFFWTRAALKLGSVIQLGRNYCYCEDTNITFAGLVSGWRLGAPLGGVSPPSSFEQQVDKCLWALQGTPLSQIFPFLLLLLLLFNLYDYTTTATHFMSLQDYLLDFRSP